MGWKTLHRSMLGQMLILAALFSAWGLYSLFALPWQAPPPVTKIAPIDLTATKVRWALSAFLGTVATKPEQTPPIADNPVIRDVVARNPGFRYALRVGDRLYGNAPGLLYYRRIGLDRFTQAGAAMGANIPCALLERDMSSRTGKAFVYYYNCGAVAYYEYYGLTNPIDVSDLTNATPDTKWFMGYAVTFLKTVGLLVLMFAGVLVVNMVMIRRVAKLSGSFDPERIDDLLPERGLPVEVVPLVRAVNSMIARLRDARAHQTFFLSAAAHEMRTPLTVLRTRLELLDDGPAKDRLVNDVRRITGLVNQLLTLMGVHARTLPDESFDLLVCVRRAVTAREPLAAARGVVIDMVDAAGAAVRVQGDNALFEVAVTNLIENAVIFSPDGDRVEVTVGADGTIAVRDHGPGISDAQLETMFQPFVRFSAHRGGHGLGLAITRAIAARHGARVTAANAPTGGAVFTIGPVGADTPS